MKTLVFLGIFFASFCAGQTLTGTHHQATPAGTSAGETGELRSYELAANGENFFSWKASDLMAGDNPYTMPAAYPLTNNDRFLICTTVGVCSWSVPFLFGDILVNDQIFLLSPTFSQLSALTADGSDTMFLFLGGGGDQGDTRGGSVSLYGNEQSTNPGQVVLWSGLGSDIIFKTAVEVARIDNTRNFILGALSVAPPTSAINTFVIGGSTAPSADPAAGVGAMWTDATLGMAYRTGVTNEGAGQTNSVHNRFVEQYGTGTAYAFTNSSAAINLGTNNPQVTIPSAGTWAINAYVYVILNGATFPASSRTVTVVWRRTNNTPANLLSSDAVACRMDQDFDTPTTTVTRGEAQLSGTCIYTTTNNNDVIALFGSVNTTPTAGSVDAVSAGSYLQAWRLF